MQTDEGKRARRRRRTALAMLVDSEAFTVAVTGLVVAFGLSSLGFLCMLEFLRNGQIELCMLGGLIVIGAVSLPLAATNRAVLRMHRRYRRLVRPPDPRHADHVEGLGHD